MEVRSLSSALIFGVQSVYANNEHNSAKVLATKCSGNEMEMATTIENLGPAERIIQTVLAYTDHLYHGRPGIVTKDATSIAGVKWAPVTHKVEEGVKVVYSLSKVGRKTTRTRVGVLSDNGQVKEGNRVIGEYRKPGLYPEVATWAYKQVAEVWKLDNEFAARWASYAFGQEHRDLKMVLSAFMLVQSRRGDPVIEAGKVLFQDDDFRDVGEAMVLILKKDVDLNPKLLLRMHDLLKLPGVAAINRELGFGKSARHPFLGRWDRAVEKWLRHREQNPKLLEGLVKAGFRTTVMDLARRVGYKPESPTFFDTLRWKQDQADDGRRTISIGKAVVEAETWQGLTEKQVCERIMLTKPDFKRVVGLLPKDIGLTRAVVAASIEAGSFSQKDLLIYSPTLEDLGLLQVQDIRQRWEKAVKEADDMRGANIASRLKVTANREKLEEASDNALKKAVEEVTKNLRVYFMVDISSSMSVAIQLVKEYLPKFLPSIPLDRIHVSVFNTQGRVIEIKHASAAGVDNAFKGVLASGGTDYGAGVRALQGFKPNPDEDVLFIFAGDEEQQGDFVHAVQQSGLNPMAFGLIKVGSDQWEVVRATAAGLGIPCFQIDNNTFSDVYAIPRTIRALVSSTPVGPATVRATTPRVTLVQTILSTELLKKPVWSVAA